MTLSPLMPMSMPAPRSRGIFCFFHHFPAFHRVLLVIILVKTAPNVVFSTRNRRRRLSLFRRRLHFSAPFGGYFRSDERLRRHPIDLKDGFLLFLLFLILGRISFAIVRPNFMAENVKNERTMSMSMSMSMSRHRHRWETSE